MKTKWFLIPILAAFAVVPCLWLQQGCAGNYPSVATMIATPTPPLAADVISNFNSDAVSVNPTLAGVILQTVVTGGGSTSGNLNANAGPVTVLRNYAGSFTTNTYGGGSSPNTINSPFLLPNPGDGSNYAINISCPLSDPPVTTVSGCVTTVTPGNPPTTVVSGCVTTVSSAYPADDLICTLISGGPSPYFDASGFTGIQFEINILPDDTNPNRVFQVAVDVTTPSSSVGGTCTLGCYNYHQAVLPSVSTGGWVTESYTWSQITYPGFGTNTGPLSNHLTKLLFLQWGFSDNGGMKNTHTDFWIDNVKFLP